MSPNLKRRKCNWLCNGERMWCIHGEYIQNWPIVIRLKTTSLILAHFNQSLMQWSMHYSTKEARNETCNQKANLSADEVQNYVKKLSLSGDVETIWEQMKDVILKVGYQCFSAHIGGMLKLAKVKNAKVHIISILKEWWGERRGDIIKCKKGRKHKCLKSSQS